MRGGEEEEEEEGESSIALRRLHAVLRVYAADGVDRIFVSHGTVGYVRCDGRGDL